MDTNDIFCISAHLNFIGEEYLDFNLENLERAYTELLDIPDISEVVILQKCNCTEIYCFGIPSHEDEVIARWKSLVGAKKFDREKLRIIRGRACIKHLLETASGLKSVTLGDNQVLGQVRSALTISQKFNHANPVLGGLFSVARDVALQVKTETNLGMGNTSVARGSVDLLLQLGTPKDVKILVYGAGATGSLLAKSLKEKGFNKVTITNRTKSKAVELVNKGQATDWINFNEVVKSLLRFEVVFLTTSRVIPRSDVDRAVFNKEQIFIDLGNPRNSSNFPSGLRVYHIGDIKDFTNRVLKVRQDSVDRANVLIKSGISKVINRIERNQNRMSIRKNYHEQRRFRGEERVEIFRKKSIFLGHIRDYLRDGEYIEVQTPYVIAVPSDPVRSVNRELFRLPWYSTKLYLRQSNQIYKQMLILSGFSKIFEIGPFWRVEANATPRHTSESIGLDVEQERPGTARELIKGVESILRYVTEKMVETGDLHESEKILNIKIYEYTEIVELLWRNGVQHDFNQDLGYDKEKLLGEIIQNLHGTSIFAIQHYPKTIKKFYTKRVENDLTETFDIIYKGWEICSGSVREIDVEIIKEGMKEFGLNASKYNFYLEMFDSGTPHGGFCIGLERLFAKLYNMSDVKQAILFPRTKDIIIP